jgi:hypothetical protein
MSKEYICNSNKYKIGGPKLDTINLPISVNKLPQKIIIGGYDLTLKSKFHVSLVCVGKIIEKNKISIPDFLNRVMDDFCSYTKNNDIDFLRYHDEFRFVSQSERRAIIAMCDISNLQEFFDLINKKYNLNVEYQPTHVTIYTLQPEIGIFITNKEDLNKLTKIIPRPAGVDL